MRWTRCEAASAQTEDTLEDRGDQCEPCDTRDPMAFVENQFVVLEMTLWMSAL